MQLLLHITVGYTKKQDVKGKPRKEGQLNELCLISIPRSVSRCWWHKNYTLDRCCFFCNTGKYVNAKTSDCCEVLIYHFSPSVNQWIIHYNIITIQCKSCTS